MARRRAAGAASAQLLISRALRDSEADLPQRVLDEPRFRTGAQILQNLAKEKIANQQSFPRALMPARSWSTTTAPRAVDRSAPPTRCRSSLSRDRPGYRRAS